MRWPWVSRSTHEDLVRRLEWERDGAIRSYDDWAAKAMRLLEGAESANKLLKDQLAAIEVERKLLLDRIVQMAGQPALYEKAETPVPEQQSTADLPEVPAAVKIDDIHKATREAMRNGTFNLPKGRFN